MFIEAIIAAALIALVSLSGALVFGASSWVSNAQRYIAPIAVGVFLSLVLFELIPETLAAAATWGGVAVAVGFVAFYILSSVLHQRFHHLAEEECERKGVATLLLIGDAIHNAADGVILGGAFLIDPAVGVATAVGLALHELPQEIVEFGVLVRAGYSRMQAALYNLISASSIVVGVLIMFVVADYAAGYMWVLTGIAAGNLLFLAASDLLPRIHGNHEEYGSAWRSAVMIILGFAVMTLVLYWTHEQFGHGHGFTESSSAHEAHELADEHADEPVPADNHAHESDSVLEHDHTHE